MPGATPPAGLESAMERLGAEVAAELDTLNDLLHAHLLQEIPVLGGEERYSELLRASIEGDLDSLVLLLRDDLPLSELTPPDAALTYAHTFAHRGIGSAPLIRAYRLGQQLVVRWGLARLADQLGEAAAFEAGAWFTDLVFSYVDRISEGIVDAYEAERERWLADRTTRRADTLDELLSGRTADARRAEAALGYRLHQHHVAVLAWVPPRHPSPQLHLTETLDSLARRLHLPGSPLTHVVDREVCWGWLPLGSTESPEVLPGLPGLAGWRAPHADTRIALGRSASGPEGFRRSHEEARLAHQVAVLAGEAPAVVGFDDAEVRAAALLATDLDQTRALVHRALGRLAAPADAAARLRETLRVFLAEQGSYVAAGERLHLHKNTIKYRVDRALAERGRDLGADRLEVELALIACRWLGPAVLAGD
ncbi:PucR family transcriptional regulator [Nocardioides sp.]|uniref:PucR family transcriptional regulator n=1 Tax=Nocardioides sp. TaxID=35761 RepID=UPI003519A162